MYMYLSSWYSATCTGTSNATLGYIQYNVDLLVIHVGTTAVHVVPSTSRTATRGEQILPVGATYTHTTSLARTY